MKNSLFLEGEILFPLNFEEAPDEYGNYNSCTYAHTTYAEPETGYYEDLCELTKILAVLVTVLWKRNIQ